MRATHPYEVFELRSMLAVPYFEKALYELPDDQLTSQVRVGGVRLGLVLGLVLGGRLGLGYGEGEG